MKPGQFSIPLPRSDLSSLRDKVEFHYRKARLEHNTGKLDAAKKYYQQVIEINGPSPWYFAPNACLQTGYILMQENNKAAAEEYFKMALSYKKHEYKNSIDTKARSALSQLRRK